MNGTYKEVEVLAPGVLRVVERAISKPAAGHVWGGWDGIDGRSRPRCRRD
jgi:hypothetical protein